MGRGGRGGAGEGTDDLDDGAQPSHVSLAGGAAPSVAWPHPPSEDGAMPPSGRSARRWSAPAVPDAVVAAPGLAAGGHFQAAWARARLEAARQARAADAVQRS
eukprot:COSAG04_NODE_11474_length_707_cov_1.039474_2_plen_102_part_01